MDLINDIKPISYIKTNAASMIKYINDTHKPIIITQNGEAKGVLLDPESYQNMINAFGILKILAQGEKDITEKKIIKHDDLMKELREEFGHGT